MVSVCGWGRGGRGVESPDSQLLCAESCFGAGNKAFPSHWIPNCPGRERALGAPPSTSLAQTVAGRLLETRAAGLHRLLELLLTEDSGLPSPAPFLELSGRLGDTPGGGRGVAAAKQPGEEKAGGMGPCVPHCLPRFHLGGPGVGDRCSHPVSILLRGLGASPFSSPGLFLLLCERRSLPNPELLQCE